MSSKTLRPLTMAQVAQRLARPLHVDVVAFTRFANEDRHGGWDHGAGVFPRGSVWRAEGQVLYALVRMLRPEYVADLGTHYGASATHLAAAIHANRTGRLVSVDRGFGSLLLAAGAALIREALVDRVVVRSRDPRLLREARQRGWTTELVVPRVAGAHYYGGTVAGYRGSRRVIQIPGDVSLPYPGHLIPATLARHCQLVIGDAIAWLRTARQLDLVFEDLDHDRWNTARVARLAARALKPGGVFLSHDALHPRCGIDVRRGLRDAGLRSISYLSVGGSDCGLAVWLKPA